MKRLDRTGKYERWHTARAAERDYNSKLQGIAKQVRLIVAGFGSDRLQALQEALNRYAVIIEPWAQSVAQFMLSDLENRSLRQWRAVSKEMGAGIRRELAYAPTGQLLRALQLEQVALITSLPREAAERVHELAVGSIATGQRARTFEAEIMATGEVTASRARLIARTEVNRASSNLLQARAEWVGSEGYIWRTSGDGDVRPTHKAMEGKYVRWSHPPKTDKNLDPYHAGCGPNCRCFAEPIFPNL